MAGQVAGEHQVKLYQHQPNDVTIWKDVEGNHLLYIAVVNDKPYEILQLAWEAHHPGPLETGMYLAEYGTWASSEIPWEEFVDRFCKRVNVPAPITELAESVSDPFAWDYVRFIDGGQWSSWRAIKMEVK